MQWCCTTFKGYFEEAGNRGLATVVERLGTGEPVFLLQFRSIEMGQEGPREYPHPLALGSQTGIIFCPWCGRNLERFYQSEIDSMVRPMYTLVD